MLTTNKSDLPWLVKYKEAFLEGLEKNCRMYKLIGFNQSESPMWLQYQGIDFDALREGKNVIKFVNSQRSAIWFTIAIDSEDRPLFQYGDYQAIYRYFRILKYDYIKENHPTIWGEQHRVK